MKSANYQPLSPVCFLEHSALVYGDKVALIYDNDHKTYGEFFLECKKLASAFRQIGLSNGSKVAYLSRNNVQLLEAHYAVPMFGGVLVPINVMLRHEEVCHILQHSDSEILIVEDKFLDESYFEIMSKIVVIQNLPSKVASKQFYSYSQFIKLGDTLDECTLYEILDESLPITINYTSGTTGSPKGAVYSHRSTYLNSLRECLTVQDLL